MVPRIEPGSPKVGAADHPDAYQDQGKADHAQRGKVFVKYRHRAPLTVT
jgi:hypothetical protein